MDKTQDYTWFKDCISSILSQEGDTFIPGFIKYLSDLQSQIVPELETENSEALHGRNTVPDEVLRKYYEITKEIRSFWFDNIDTHLLTILRLSDQTLARRRAYERSLKGNGPLRIEASDGKAVVQKTTAPKKDAGGDILGALKGLSPADLAALMLALGKK